MGRNARRSLGRRVKHLQDVRGTYAPRLVQLGLSDQEVSDIIGWSAQQVNEIRRIHVEDVATDLALTER